MIKSGRRPMSEAAGTTAIINAADFSLGKVQGNLYNGLVAPIKDAASGDRLTEIYIELWGGSVWSFQIRIGHTAYGGIAEHEFPIHATVRNQSEKLSAGAFKSGWDAKEVAKAVDKVLQSKAPGLFGRIWGGASLTVSGKVDPKAIQSLINYHAGKL